MKALAVTNIQAVEIQVDPEFITARELALVAARDVVAVNDEFSQTCAVDALRELQDLAKTVEKSRTIFKAPVLALGRSIDAKAAELAADITTEAGRLQGLTAKYQDGLRRAAEAAERARLAEVARIEAEQRAAAEAERKAKEDAQAAFTAQQQQEALAARQAEQAKLKALERESIAVRTTVVAAPVKPAGLVVKSVCKFEVVNLEQLYKARPDLCRIEASTAAINEAMRAGAREIPGLRIWEETKTEVRS